MSDEYYQELILAAAKDPQYAVPLTNFTHQAVVTNASCGDELTVWLRVSQEKIVEVGWQGQGCTISRAAMSLLSEKLAGKSVTWISQLTPKEIQKWLGLPNISLGRVKCLTLGLTAVRTALGFKAKLC